MMNNIFLHPGHGIALRKVANSTGNVVSEDTTIPDGGYSEIFSGNDCKEWMLLFMFEADETPDSLGTEGSTEGSLAVEQMWDADATYVGDDFDSVTVSTEKITRFNAGECLTGYFRVRNDSGRAVTAYLQKRIK